MSPGADHARAERASGAARTEWWRTRLRRASRLTRVRLRHGAGRVRSAFVPVLQASLAAGLAFAIAQGLLGHEYPFFASVAAWVALGFSTTRELRRVVELAIGVAVGVALGEVVVHLVGAGPVQVAGVLMISALLARLLDGGVVLTMQAGAQSMVVIGLPVLQTGTAIGRWTDAVVGGLVALAVAVLSPHDVRRPPRARARRALHELRDVLARLSRGVRNDDVDDVQDALVHARGTEKLFDDWRTAVGSSLEVARVSPRGRRHRGEVSALAAAAVSADHAMRNTRVLARRTRGALRSGHELEPIADIVAELAGAAGVLGDALGSGSDVSAVRTTLRDVARRLDPWTLGRDDWHVQSLVLLLRSLTVDLLEVSGLDQEAARADLPEL